MEVALRNFHGKTEYNQENLNDNRCPGQDSNRTPPDCRFKSFPPYQPSRFQGRRAYFCHVYVVTIDGVWIGEWIYWPLIPLDSELQTITAPLLISTIHKSTQHSLSLFSACCVFTRHSLATATNSAYSSASRAHVVPSPTPVQNCLLLISSGTRMTLLITSRHEPHRKHRFHCYSPKIPRLLLAHTLSQKLV
jgi:hypothetical protein